MFDIDADNLTLQQRLNIIFKVHVTRSNTKNACLSESNLSSDTIFRGYVTDAIFVVL